MKREVKCLVAQKNENGIDRITSIDPLGQERSRSKISHILLAREEIYSFFSFFFFEKHHSGSSGLGHFRQSIQKL